VEDKQPPSFLALAGLGISIALCVAGGLLLGVYLDDKTHDSPLFALVGLLVGVVIGVGLAYVEIKRLM
jgi:F0F1-type ATP synthase assembly protein I